MHLAIIFCFFFWVQNCKIPTSVDLKTIFGWQSRNASVPVPDFPTPIPMASGNLSFFFLFDRIWNGHEVSPLKDFDLIILKNWNQAVGFELFPVCQWDSDNGFPEFQINARPLQVAISPTLSENLSWLNQEFEVQSVLSRCRKCMLVKALVSKCWRGNCWSIGSGAWYFLSINLKLIFVSSILDTVEDSKFLCTLFEISTSVTFALLINFGP